MLLRPSYCPLYRAVLRLLVGFRPVVTQIRMELIALYIGLFSTFTEKCIVCFLTDLLPSISGCSPDVAYDTNGDVSNLIALYIGLFSNCIYHSSISEYHMNSLFSTVNFLKSGTTVLTKSPSKPHIYVILYFCLYYAFCCPTFFYPTYFLRFRA